MIVLNGNLEEKQMVNLDRGFLYGCGVFETILMKGHQPILLEEHLTRLNKGLKTLNIAQVLKETDARNEIKKLQANNCALRISVSDENILYSTRPMTYKKEHYEKGFSVKVSEITRNPKSHITYIKSFNYMDNGIERQSALDAGFNEVLFLNGEGLVAEGSTSNIFFIKDNSIYTPSVECGLLVGVLRNWVMVHYPVIEGKFTIEQVINAEGVFLTNSLMGIMKVSQIGDAPINNHPLIQKLQKEYTNFLEDYCHE